MAEDDGRWWVKQVLNPGFKEPYLVDVCKAIGVEIAGLVLAGFYTLRRRKAMKKIKPRPAPIPKIPSQNLSPS